MQNFKVLAFYCGFFFINYTFSQDFNVIPDSLKKYTYEDLDRIMTKRKNKTKNTYVYAKTYLLKAKKENNISEIIYGYISIGNEAGNLDFNLKYSDSAIALAKKKKPDDLSYLYYLRGNRYYSEKKLKEALDCYLTANKYPNTSLDLADRINYSIGLIKNTQGNYEEAIEIYKKCEENGRGPKFDNYLLYVLGLSELYNRVDKIDLSEKYIKIGIASCKDYPTGDYFLPYFISNRGKNYFKRKEYQKAIQDLTSQSKDIQQNNDFSNYAENSFYIAECYRELHQDEKAVDYYKKVDSVFVAKEDIYLTTITAYQHLINYYRKQKDYKNEVYYADQFIKADKVLDDNYKYLTSRITKTYDIQQVISSKQDVIASLKKDRKHSIATIIFLVLGIILLAYILHLNNKKKKKEIQKQKELFEAYRLEREQHAAKQTDNQESNIVMAKKTTLSNIDESVVANILSCLDQFEKEQWYLNKEYTVEMLASEFKTNSNYLSKVINEIKGASFTQYMNMLRIEYILEKLETDKRFLQYTIQALSEFAGYNSVQTFTRAFTNQTKMKPSDFLKELRNRNL